MQPTGLKDLESNTLAQKTVSLEAIQPVPTKIDDYYEKYRQKFKKINALVSLLSAKTRKIKYHFMILLERQVKKPITTPVVTDK